MREAAGVESGAGAAGSGEAADLFASLYDELRAIAERMFRSQPSDHTLQATALVHEAFIKVAQSSSDPSVNDRQHALALGARAMRQLLINHAHASAAQKRGGDWRRVTLSGLSGSRDEAGVDTEAIARAREELERLNERQCRVIECKYFGGLTTAETARVLGVSDRTVELDAKVARLWLLAKLESPADGSPGDSA